MQTDIDPRDLIGHRAVDRNGDKIGTVDEVYLDDATGEPEWAAVRTGIFGRDAFVPLTTSEFSGEELRVPYDKSLVKDSPDFGVGQHLSPAQELQLYRYYGLDTPADNRSGSAKDTGADDRPADMDFGAVPGTAGTAAAGAAVAGGAAAATAGRGSETPAPEKAEKLEKLERPVEPPAAGAPATAVGIAAAAPERRSPAAEETNVRTVGAPAPTAGQAAPAPMYAKPAEAEPLAAPGADAATSAPGGPVEITCHEERLDISTEWQVTYTARLRKYVTSETVERHVPVVRERVRVERVPVTEGERDALTQEEIAEAVEEVTLREERPVVRKYLVPIERVRLVVERFTEDHVVREELHREHVEIQDGSTAGAPGQASAHAAPAGHTARASQPAQAAYSSGGTGAAASGESSAMRPDSPADSPSAVRPTDSSAAAPAAAQAAAQSRPEPLRTLG
ncbi:hypothetical protein GCM10010495_52100 [Kitasatospora herbaricolor]|uniref:PRC and DUF2382 domain-containing protein n=1 Tax=Kitasatospora herbaricolor TaxID=68217 RepID=UPI00174890A5|nr:PRC and DUF2382 domain-containing protein [Kitasatospora herbaricolor]MDQ0307167.1 sporulation protein YlmC with PRC-barrel domain [Kitasatospora herbaricolor]GGV29384.1 hypothetical protein GCM10010495_52100 [Kitasatospora herbaricolor]